MSRHECYIGCPCPFMATEKGKDFCTREDGKCEYQILGQEEHWEGEDKMQEVFEKIIERLGNEIFSAELYGDEWDGQTVTNLLCLGDVRDVIEQVAAEYEKDNYFNLDEVTLHECPVCGGAAEHRVKKNGCWACGCFKCKVFKFDHNHGKAIQAWEDFCTKYNSWIPVENGTYPTEYEDVEVTIEETIDDAGEKRYYTARSWLQDGQWAIKKSPYHPTVIAWRYPTEPYQPKRE